jgi:hypothetical protein
MQGVFQMSTIEKPIPKTGMGFFVLRGSKPMDFLILFKERAK